MIHNDATHDFFTLVVEAYILVAAMKAFEMDSLESVPSEKLVPEGANSWMIEDNERQRLLDSLLNQLLKTFFAGELHNPSAVDNNSDDKVLLYSKYLLTFGCFYLSTVMQSEKVTDRGYCDAGDICFPYLLVQAGKTMQSKACTYLCNMITFSHLVKLVN